MERAAAILLPLFSLWTENDLGRGDIGALRPFARWILKMGHRMLQLLPLSETAAGENSPYSALSVFSIDPLYVSVDELVGVPHEEIERARTRVRGRRTIARAELRALKLPLLRAAFAHFYQHAGAAERSAFEKFVAENRHWLEDYALFRALKDRFDWAGWQHWPADIRDFERAPIAAARRELQSAMTMYSYWQYLAHEQWRNARAELAAWGIGLIGDLAFLPATDSADVWSNQHLFILDRQVGAPPDAFSASGQRWGLPMPNWPRMRSDDLRWWRERARKSAQLYDAVRIDHVVGFYRTYSFSSDPDEPGEFFPQSEAAQREQGEAFFMMLNQEIGEGRIIGEDLGTVPPWVRLSLTALGVLGLKVFRWEKKDWHTPRERFIPPAEFPELSVAVTSTHDTETLAQWWRESAPAERLQLASAMKFPASLDIASPTLKTDLLDAILGQLYASPSRLVLAPIQDLFGWEERINVPGSVDDRNWTYRLPQPVERLAADRAIEERTRKLFEMARQARRIRGDV